ncbi:MAG TPA: sensor histidine kinase [Anaerolineaceae bacterium]|nr:sensor histidine kinase [Anaerolineaceae bacterium]HPN54008.1 sensor histidine kinase [Anaerolineaceae bacterium]
MKSRFKRWFGWVPYVSRALRPFKRLQWKLTVAYTFITVLVLSLLLLVLMIISSQMIYGMPEMELAMAEALTASASSLTPALEADPPDTAALQAWMDKTISENEIMLTQGEDTSQTSEGEFIFTYTSNIKSGSLLLILDENGRVLISNHPELTPAGEVFPEVLHPQVKSLINDALQPDTQARQFLGHDEVRSIAVTRILSSDSRRMVGMAVLVLQLPDRFETLVSSVLSIIPVIMFLTILAGLIGMVFGALMARGLTRRLKKAMAATDAWGQGDFSVRLNDKTEDEIGQLAQDLNQMADELRSLMQTRQELAALEERNRLARDLHDSVKQQVFAISMNLAAAQTLFERKPEEARKRLDMALGISRQSQQELTTLIQTLRPVELTRQGLPQAIKEMLASWEKQSGVAVVSQIQNEASLPAAIEQALFRMVQEALSNISRHSGASAVSVTFQAQSGQVSLQISDNGHGFDASQPSRGLGLHSMQERVQSVGGSLAIESSSNGTRLNVIVPLPEIQKEIA